MNVESLVKIISLLKTTLTEIVMMSTRALSLLLMASSAILLSNIEREVLTATMPFSEEELRKAGYIEMEWIMRDDATEDKKTLL